MRDSRALIVMAQDTGYEQPTHIAKPLDRHNGIPKPVIKLLDKRFDQPTPVGKVLTRSYNLLTLSSYYTKVTHKHSNKVHSQNRQQIFQSERRKVTVAVQLQHYF